MRIYTRTGDDGTTGLFGGGRVSKADPRLECYGTLDEVNAALGLAAAAEQQGAEVLRTLLRQIQSELFVIGAHLATPADSPHRSKLPPWNDDAASRLEREIDAAESATPPLKQFILPGGSEMAARLHLARTICRRAERLIVPLLGSTDQMGQAVAATPAMLVYLNRLSDWLFAYARQANAMAGVADLPWVR